MRVYFYGSMRRSCCLRVVRVVCADFPIPAGITGRVFVIIASPKKHQLYSAKN